MPNAENIRLLRDFIDRHPPENCIMADVSSERSCGTCYCILGFAQELWHWSDGALTGIDLFTSKFEIPCNRAVHLMAPCEVIYLDDFDDLDPSLRKSAMLATLDELAKDNPTPWLDSLRQVLSPDDFERLVINKSTSKPSADYDRDSNSPL